jgi:hypothetical protein
MNHARILEIRTGTKHAAIKAASSDELDEFLATWPNVDPETGLSLRGAADQGARSHDCGHPYL